MTADTIPQRLIDQAQKQGEASALFEKRDGAWKSFSWREYGELVRRASKALIALGCAPGSTTCILGFNRMEWVVFDLASMSIGGAPAGIYGTSSPSEVRYIVDHAQSPVVLVENVEQWKKVEKERANLPHLRQVVTMRGCPRIDDPLVLSWEDFLARGDQVPDLKYLERVHALEPEGLATLIYTSGTTGPPKGVMLTHRNLAWTADVAVSVTGATTVDCSLSYLPLAHIAEQMFSVHCPITAGMSVWFAESIEKVPDNLKEVRPTVFFAVPRIWEKFYTGIGSKLAVAKGLKARIAGWARSVGTAATAFRMRGEPLPLALRLKYRLADRLVFSKLKAAIGLDRAKICVSGAAPVSKEVLEFMASLDVIVHEVYGQSEDTGPTTFNTPGKVKLGTVGPVFPGVEVRLAEDGEILVRGPNVFKGYYKEPEATAAALIDGWLQSGDLGSLDPNGFLTITGRKKEILITAGGKNIAPKNLEAALKNHPLVNEAVVIGDRRKYLTALVTLDPDALTRFCTEHGLQVATAPQSEQVRSQIQQAVDRLNEEVARVEQVKKFAILPRNFTIQDGELTPTLKVKRKAVAEHFAAEIEAMYVEA
ncbi:MAG: long-chain fatty acid--CoA ligase [Myxococcaceae bacterium]|nr:long-chain fatty acid--CoA ligase [Myxococcaceae bacterium]